MNTMDFTVIATDKNSVEKISKLGFANTFFCGKENLREAFKNLNTKFLIFCDCLSNNSSNINKIMQLARLLAENPNTLVALQNNNERNLPVKIYEFLSGTEGDLINCSLMGMCGSNAEILSNVKCGDANFYKNILLEAKIQGMEIVQLTNVDAPKTLLKFGILKDTMRLYVVFIKFSISALISYIVDIGSFFLFLTLFKGIPSEIKILLATLFSRILCSVATYAINKGAVFKASANKNRTVFRFVILAVAQLVLSWLAVSVLSSLLHLGDIADTLFKVVVDLIIFLLSFTLQRDWVFNDD